MAELDIALLGSGTLRIPWVPGDVVKGSTLLSKLATGGMAEIWLARQAGMKGFEKLVVIKRMTDVLCEDPEFVEMFLDEARIAAQLSHPGIVQIYDLGEKDGAFFIIMEYLAGENLLVVLREGNKLGQPLPFELSARIIANMAAALGYAHGLQGQDGRSLGIVHRDVSPQNILLTYGGDTKILDFGIAKAAHRSAVTQSGKLKGKFSYMSPEHARGEAVDHRSDQFELGIVLYELLTRAKLYKSDDAAQALAIAMAAHEIEPPHLKNPEVPVELSAICMRAMQRDPDKRFETCTELATTIEYWLKLQSGVPSAGELSAYMTQLFGSRIVDRTRLLERARTNDLTPAARAELPEAAKNQSSGSASMLVDRRPWAGFVIAGCLAFAAAIGAWALWPAKTIDASVTIETDPPGAVLKLDGAKIGLSPFTAHVSKLGKHELTAELDGHTPVTRTIEVKAADDRQTHVLSLPELVVAAQPVVDEKEPLAQPAANAKPALVAAAPKPVPFEKAPRAAVRPAGKGRLTLDTVPWTSVFLGAQKLGDTPLVEVPLPPGIHVLKLVNEGQNISSQVQVEVKPGKTTTMKMKL